VPNSRPVALFGGLASALLLGSVALRMYRDSSLLKAAGPLSNPSVAALIAIEVVPLALGALLGLAAGWIAWLNWTKNPRSRTATLAVFGTIVVGGLFVATYAAAPGLIAGWALAVLGGAGLISAFWAVRQL